MCVPMLSWHTPTCAVDLGVYIEEHVNTFKVRDHSFGHMYRRTRAQQNENTKATDMWEQSQG